MHLQPPPTQWWDIVPKQIKYITPSGRMGQILPKLFGILAITRWFISMEVLSKRTGALHCLCIHHLKTQQNIIVKDRTALECHPFIWKVAGFLSKQLCRSIYHNEEQ